uniref:Uncharacterized protein n=1 Tax=Romanomermis culicivorax TaxID=13658 RepID=A0A915IJ83_ROMCU
MCDDSIGCINAVRVEFNGDNTQDCVNLQPVHIMVARIASSLIIIDIEDVAMNLAFQRVCLRNKR